MKEYLDLEHWTNVRESPVPLPHGRTIPTSIRGFMWARELVHLNQVAWQLKQWRVEGGVLEIGSYCGLSAAALGQPGPLTCVDTFTDVWGPSENERYTRPEFDRNMDLMRIRPRVLEMNSHEALPLLKKEGAKFRLVLVDGGHAYAEAKFDIDNSIPLLSHRGVMVIDDRNVEGVNRAAEESGMGLERAPGGKLLFAAPIPA